MVVVTEVTTTELSQMGESAQTIVRGRCRIVDDRMFRAVWSLVNIRT